jgi:hypothetical protein
MNCHRIRTEFVRIGSKKLEAALEIQDTWECKSLQGEFHTAIIHTVARGIEERKSYEISA